VGQWYRDFSQTSDGEVRALLDAAGPDRAAAPPPAPIALK
jgi:predicted phosphoribosyltransferase